MEHDLFDFLEQEFNYGFPGNGIILGRMPDMGSNQSTDPQGLPSPERIFLRAEIKTTMTLMEWVKEYHKHIKSIEAKLKTAQETIKQNQVEVNKKNVEFMTLEHKMINLKKRLKAERKAKKKNGRQSKVWEKRLAQISAMLEEKYSKESLCPDVEELMDNIMSIIDGTDELNPSDVIIIDE
jgi:DNA repair exonuclease SbcCD ATPase subunit